MTRLFILIAASILVACASAPATPPAVVSVDCGKRAAHHRGHEDAAAGRPSDSAFVALCPEESQDQFRAAYAESYRREKRMKEAHFIRQMPTVAMPRLQLPPSDSWVCEVEGGSHIFTGVGATRADASGAASNTCGSYLEATSCGPAECSSQM